MNAHLEVHVSEPAPSNPRPNRSGWVIAIGVVAALAGGLAAITGGNANAHHITGTKYTAVIEQGAANPQVLSRLDVGKYLPTSLKYHFGPGQEFAHNDGSGSVTPIPADNDVVGFIRAVADYNIDGCGDQDTTNGTPDNANLMVFWKSAMQATKPANAIAELNIPASSINLTAYITHVTGAASDPQGAASHYDLTAQIPIGLVACPGTELVIEQISFSNTRTTTQADAAASPPKLSAPTDRMFQKAGSTSKNCVFFGSDDPDDPGVPVTHDACANYTQGAIPQYFDVIGGAPAQTTSGTNTSTGGSTTANTTGTGGTSSGTGSSSSGTGSVTAAGAGGTGSQVAAAGTTRGRTSTAGSTAGGGAAGAAADPLASTGSPTLNLIALSMLLIAIGLHLVVTPRLQVSRSRSER